MMKRLSVFFIACSLSAISAWVFAQPAANGELDAKAREFVQLVLDEKFDQLPPLMDETMNNAMTADRWKQLASGLERQLGTLNRIEGARRADAAGYRIVFVRAEFEKSKIEFRVVYNQDDLVSGFFMQPAAEWKPPAYADPAKFTEEEVTVGAEGFPLPGTLTVPKDIEKPPVVVFVHGSGPNDRDETIGPNKTFRDLAWGLATKGIASLRYDKRTLVHRDKLDSKTLTYREESVDDALAAIEFVARDPRFDADRIVLVGHSMGGSLAPAIASESKALDAAIIMAGTNRTIEELMMEQLHYIAMEDGAIDEDETKLIEEIREAFRKVEAGEVASNLGGMGKRYFDAFQAYDAIETAKQLTIPLFIVQGARDYQVTAEKDFAAWKVAFEGKPNVTLKLYEDLNHLFMPGEGPSYPAEYMAANNVSEEYVNDLAEWIAALKDANE